MNIEGTFNNFSQAWGKLDKQSAVGFKSLEEQKSEINALFRLLVHAITNREQVVLIGAGRCADILEMFKVRLIQLGFPRASVKLVKQYNIDLPSDRKAIAICLSGTGLTTAIIDYAKHQSLSGNVLALITGNRDSPLVVKHHAHIVIHLPGITEIDLETKRENPDAEGEEERIFFDFVPTRTLFEFSAVCFFESLIAALNEAKKVDWKVGHP